LGNWGVIFDSDGVIVDSEPFSLSAFRDAMKMQGVFLSDEDIMANCGLTDSDIVNYVFKKFGQNVDQELFHTTKQRLYEEKVTRGNLQPCEGAKEILEALSKCEIPYTLASSGSLKKIHFNLTRVNLLDRFPIIISGEQMVRGKPHPDIFLKAAKKMNLAPESCVVIEDSLNGIEAAHRANMKCVAVEGTFPREKLTHADFIVESLGRIEVNTLQTLAHDKNFSKGGNSC